MGVFPAGKPSRKEYRDALVSQVQRLNGREAGSDDLVRCLADEAYERLSTEAVRATVDETTGYLPSEADMDVLAAANKACVDTTLPGPDDMG